ncbi:hypothetical protein MLD38_007149 [Melastoma candidum]|uniref:Uncharacterized protein n=1 Tax=Melastoma candidum TaxID=119954 RepID=A0ACB9RPG4_9MYRT|nr:hypothetical protein MLD38_007149 [Melastoma candidum]
MASSKGIIIMAEVIIAKLIGKLHEVLSEKAILHQELGNQLYQFIEELEDILCDTSGGNKSGVDILQQFTHMMRYARDAEDIMENILVESSRRQLHKSLKGRFIHTVAELVGCRDSHAEAQKLIQKLVDVLYHYSTIRGRSSPRLKLFGESGRFGSHRAESLMMRRTTITAATRASVSISGMPGIIGREGETKALKNMLKESKGQFLISVNGEEGIGKTALVRSVYNCPETERLFRCRAWISCSKDMSQGWLLAELIKQSLTKELKDLDRREIEDLLELLSSLWMESRYLIVLDIAKGSSVDISWIPCKILERCGSKLILISRNFLASLGSYKLSNKLDLETLKEDSSRKFLPENTRTEGSEDEILEICGGSPLKLILWRELVMDVDAGSLGEPYQYWKIEEVMYWIFRKLPPWVKPCLFHLCLFPRESEIRTRRIFQLWYTEGLAGRYGPDTPEDCLQELLDRNIVQVDRRRPSDQKPKACHLLGCWHDYLSKLGTGFGLLHIEGENKHVSRGPIRTKASHWIARRSGDSTTHPPLDADTVLSIQSYISFQTAKKGTRSREVKQLLKPLQRTKDRALLRVLDLEGVYRPTLPVQFGDLLPNLRYLGLRQTILDSLPNSVANLSKLETLDLKHTEVTKLPGSILKLKSLRHLYLNEVSFDKEILSGDFGNNLETLWGLSVGKGSAMLKALNKFKGLRKLGMTCHSVDVLEVMENLTTLFFLELFRLRSRDHLGQPGKVVLSPHMKGMPSLLKLYLLGRLNGFRESIACLPKNLRVLTLSVSNLQYDPMSYLGELPHLVRLSLLARSFIGQTITCRKGSFRSLRELRLWKLEKLREITLEDGSMESLEELEIRGCNELLKMDNLSNASKLKRIKLAEVAEGLVSELSKKHQNLFVISRDLPRDESIFGLSWRERESELLEYGGHESIPGLSWREREGDLPSFGDN